MNILEINGLKSLDTTELTDVNGGYVGLWFLSQLSDVYDGFWDGVTDGWDHEGCCDQM